MKTKPTRARLTWDEIREIKRNWYNDIDGPATADINKLVKHIRFIEHLWAEDRAKVKAYESLHKSKL